MGRGKRTHSGTVARPQPAAVGRTLDAAYSWTELDKLVPWLSGPDLHSVALPLYQASDGTWAVEVRQPGKHQDETYEPGGDFVVVVFSRSAGWEKGKMVQHQQVFKDVEEKCRRDEHRDFMEARFLPVLYWAMGYGDAYPPHSLKSEAPADLPGLEIDALLASSQALALAEYRRFRKYEARGGGRQLPARLIAGIIERRWNALECAAARGNGLRHLNLLHAERGQTRSIRTTLEQARQSRS